MYIYTRYIQYSVRHIDIPQPPYIALHYSIFCPCIVVGDVRGDIRINGCPVDENISQLSTFIPQHNLRFIETLSTTEHLEFMV